MKILQTFTRGSAPQERIDLIEHRVSESAFVYIIQLSKGASITHTISSKTIDDATEIYNALRFAFE